MRRLATWLGAATCCVLAGGAIVYWTSGELVLGEGEAQFSIRSDGAPSGADEILTSVERLARLPRGEQVRGPEAVRLCLHGLEEGIRRLKEHPDYVCAFHRQERVGGELLDPDDVTLAIRHEPFSVALYWPDSGRHVVWVDGQNGNRMLVNVGGGSWFLSRLKLDPHDSRVMAEARYPIMETGLLKLAERIAKYRRRDLTLTGGFDCRIEAGQEIAGRDCYQFTIEYDDPQIEPVYRKSIISLDRETLLPVSILNYTWSDKVPNARPGHADEDTLIEHYVYRDLRFDNDLTDDDFSLANPPQLELAAE